MKTPTQIRIEIAACLDDGITDPDCIYNKLNLQTLDFDLNAEQQSLFELARNSLLNDVQLVLSYRQQCDELSEESFNKWFAAEEAKNPQISFYNVFSHIDPNRDFIYNSHGLKLLINRYLLPNEPIQYGMLRIALMMSRGEKTWLLMYTLLSCGYLMVSSIVAHAHSAHRSILPGEACRLIVPPSQCRSEFVERMYDVCKTISLGVGVGLAASTIPKIGSKVSGVLHNGFSSVVKLANASNNISLYERKPKIAFYISMHNDTIFEAFELKHPAHVHMENCFIGLMVSDHFMRCLRDDEIWYLFPSDATMYGKNLSDFYGDEYALRYQEFVSAKLYSKALPAKTLAEQLVTSICVSGSPYIVFEDTVNKYSNHKHLGKIKTLNLCAEIANYADEQLASSCTLITVNFAMFRDFPSQLDDIYREFEQLSTTTDTDYTGFDMPELSKYAFVMGFFGTMALNQFMGRERECRELGVSPCGVYDMASIAELDCVDVCAVISEAMYMGAAHGSHYSFMQKYRLCAKYISSPFSEGRPQWNLRNVTPRADWSSTIEKMREGMSNSMLTAQAPTATTSMLVGIAESVTIPMSIYFAKESENGRNGVMIYSIIYHLLNNPTEPIDIDCSLERQIEMYAVSAPFVDQSQSTMFSIELSKQNVFNLIIDTYKAKLKTGIYYILPKQQNRTLNVVRDLSNMERKCILGYDTVDCDGCSL